MRGALGQSGRDVVPNRWAVLHGFADVFDLADPTSQAAHKPCPERKLDILPGTQLLGDPLPQA